MTKQGEPWVVVVVVCVVRTTAGRCEEYQLTIMTVLQCRLPDINWTLDTGQRMTATHDCHNRQLRMCNACAV